MRRSWMAVGGALVAASAGCTWTTDLPASATAIHVERDRELVVTDDGTLSALSRNDADGPLSFRHVMEHLATRDTASAATLAWLDAWSQRLRDEGDVARGDSFDATITCAWLRRNPANVCSDACDRCAAKDLRLEDAPLRLVAVANRTDLSVLPDRASDGGEGRLVFAWTDGPADVATSASLASTVIVEYAQQGTAKDWANRWHALGTIGVDAFPNELAKVVGAFVETGSLAQIRTGDALTGPLVLHEFHLASGDLVPSDVRNTPDFGAVAEADVRAFCDGNGPAIENGTHVIPRAWLAKASALASEPPAYLATVASHDALVHGTCGGCHRDADRGFQIDPLATGDQKLSRFLVDPTKGMDEIGRRTEWMQLTLTQ